jgi:hypothetical protein
VTTRFDGWSPLQCLAVLMMLLAGLMASLMLRPHDATTIRTGGQMAGAGIALQQAPAQPNADAEAMSDIKVYQRVVQAVAAGETYYAVVAREHRLHNYPLKPYFTIRPPTLAWLSAGFGETGTRLLMFALIGLTALAWLEALRGLAALPLVQYTSFGLIAESAFVLSNSPYLYFHESWAALLIALSIALRRPDRFVFSIAAGLAAVLFRELALPFLLLMGIAATYAKCWREACGWGVAIAVAVAAQGAHAAAVMAVTTGADAASQGWSGLGGWSFFLTATANSTLLEFVPMWATALIVPFSLFGWIAWRSDFALRVVGLIVGYATLLIVFARPDNSYWAILIVPFLFTGVGFGAVGIWRLWDGCQPLLARSIVITQ